MPTRGEIKTAIRKSPTHRIGTPLYEDVDEYLNDDIQIIVDTLAEKTWCYAPNFITGLVADQEVYCAPAYFELKGAAVLNENGDWRPLFVTSVTEADARMADTWRNLQSADPPTHLIYRGFNKYLLAPTPSVTRAAALSFEGFAKPGIYWSYDSDTGAGEAITDSSTPPLPDWAQDVDIIANGVIALRCERWADTQEGRKFGYEAAALRAQRRFDEQVRRIYRHAFEYRSRAAQTGLATRYSLPR